MRHFSVDLQLQDYLSTSRLFVSHWRQQLRFALPRRYCPLLVGFPKQEQAPSVQDCPAP